MLDKLFPLCYNIDVVKGNTPYIKRSEWNMINDKLICPNCKATLVVVPEQELPGFGTIAKGAGCNSCGNFFFLQKPIDK